MIKNIYREYDKNGMGSKFFSDSWSLIHMISFFILSFLLKKKNISNNIILIICFITGLIFEIVENNKFILNKINYPNYNGDSRVNIFGDMIFNLIGALLGLKIKSNFIFILIFIILNLILHIFCKLNYFIGLEFTIKGFFDIIYGLYKIIKNK